ncbi:MAG: flagellar M-ring protein FliF [Lentisphaerae bacterium GWF2_45_14]|nr:MAG: flagellar M-ring protein FliF [Lentisphaerae bacterium GWF2_45_14]
MDGIFGNLLNALAEIWKNIGVTQKVSIVLIGIVTILATGVIIYVGSQPDWQVLYANLDQKTAAQVYDMVKEGGTEVKLTNSGRTIMVPSKEVYALRLKVAGEGISIEKTGVGLEIFEKLKLGATDREQQIAYQRAIQGELERMINEMPGILSSKVLLTMPGKKVFRKDKERPSASVMLVLENSISMASQQINSIRYMVASAVSGMTSQDVTIADNRGNLLVRQVGDDEEYDGDTSRHLEISEKTERALKEKAEAILRPIVGFENVVAMVSCEMDFNNIDRVVETYNPDGAVAITEKTTTESNSKVNAANKNGGPVGMASNMNQVVDVANAGKSKAPGAENVSEESRKTVERNFVVPKTVERTSVKGPRIKKLTVAVTIARELGEGKSLRSPEELKKFEGLVSSAVGVENYFTAEELKKNPIVTVQEMPFMQIAKPELPAEVVTDKIVYELEKYSKSPLIRPVVGFGILALLYLVFRKYFNRTSPAVEGAEFSSMGGQSSIYGEDLKKIESTEQEEKEKNEREMLLDSLDKNSKASPQAVADILERWMASDQG